MMVIVVLLAVVAAWALLGWLVRREGGKVRFSEAELAYRRFACAIAEFERTIGEAFMPALVAVNAAVLQLSKTLRRKP